MPAYLPSVDKQKNGHGSNEKDDMGTEAPYDLLANDAVQSLMGEARRRLAGISRADGSYRALVQVARIHQDIGNAISDLAYEAVSQKVEIACVRGCHACCLIPSEARGVTSGSFSMSMLDAITIIEHYEEIKRADAGLPDRARWAASEARRTKDLVQCPHLGVGGECRIYALRPVACKIWFSADLTRCVQNRQQGYHNGINGWTDTSNQLRKAFEEPFAEVYGEVMQGINFDGYDFLLGFEEIAKLDGLGLFDLFRSKVNAGELSTWEPV
ncbi:YkgJ family cysteine cluster protein [Magnetospirillum sulfuroxidans]|uniref:YkgJ family cysteine cluster protein n=1 Tax=Magnetospirillum sulfuroxidans TaxID=611300 RepID=A0ABS5I781_9PROT|nr:YkgJ family cysteine cluster protein [Magnetospirillum sulfuroxidans]MBR9970269.1 YkgJ family cysteine cluster protein [Magnetospirillum sulfuroxidans]